MSDEYDLNGDGVTDAFSYDSNGDGYGESIVVDRNEDGVADEIQVDTDLSGDVDAVFDDDDQNGAFDNALVDQDDDSVFETAVALDNGVIPDADGDGIDDRAELQQITIGGQGRPDGVPGLLLTMAELNGTATFGTPDSDHDGFNDDVDYSPTDPTRA